MRYRVTTWLVYAAVSLMILALPATERTLTQWFIAWKRRHLTRHIWRYIASVAEEPARRRSLLALYQQLCTPSPDAP